ncbi:MAG TPA: transketolase [Candidatus Limnocylindria bacterium]|jgi:transketolase|nr:transketolase [Candidatus Limnocylindria bacterium]
MATATESATRLDLYRELARQLRVDSIRCSTAAGSGHPTSSLSAADLMAVLLSGHLRYDFAHPDDPANDHLIFSKGHASPLLYSIFKAAGAISDGELLTFRKLGSRLEGHPTPVRPWVDVATGSLGQGLPIGVGVAMAGKRLLEAPYRVWVLVGDSETAEGSIWEAFDAAGHEELGNLIAILDVNRLGQRGPTELEWNMGVYAARVRAFGIDPIVIDGHDLAEIDDAYTRAAAAGRPTAILARTIKGKGVSFIEDKEGWHGKALDPESAQKALAELGEARPRTFQVAKPPKWERPSMQRTGSLSLKTYAEPIATRKAYGEALAALGAARKDIVVVDAEVSNSTHAEDFKKTAPDRFFEMYIAEQKMVAVAVGMYVAGFVPFASTFAAFFTRAYDFIRMAAISRAEIRLVGSHAGVSIGEDGPSQMGLEDLAMMRAVHGSTVLYPCDGNQTAKLVAQMADRKGITYLRTTREKTPVIYPPGEEFEIGWCKVVRWSESDRVTIIGAGITLHEALKAHEALAAQQIPVRVIDLYTVKPIDADAIADSVKATGGRVVVVEDHWAEGGIGDAVVAALAEKGVREVRYRHLAVRKMPGSGKPAELLDDAGISTVHIVRAVKALLG